MHTQWRTDFGVRRGLDYNVLFQRLSRIAKDEQDYELLLDDIQLMEAAALNAMADN